MREVLERRPAIALAAQRHALTRRSWAVVGNGINRVAAEEVRIKLSELCYKSISCDITEDKKHIDLSAEPMILVCAAGLHGSNADDVGKEIAIYRAHKSAPIVIADDGEARFLAALETLTVPVVHPDVSFVLCAMVGHLFGYEAALAIDATARPLREARGCIEALIGSSREGDDLLRGLAVEVQPHADRFFDGLRTSSYDGALDAGTAVRLASLLRYATGVVPLDVYQVEFGKVGTPSTVIEDLTARADEGDRGADAPDRRDQAPGEDRHRRDLALRRDAAASATRAGAPRDRRGARQPHLPRVADDGGARPGDRRGRRVGRVTGSTATRAGRARRSKSSTPAGSRATSRPAPRRTRRCAAPSTAPRASARSPWCAAAPTAARS